MPYLDSEVLKVNATDSLLDGTPTLRLNEFMLASVDKGQIPMELPEGEKATSKMPQPEEIVFELDAKLKKQVAESSAGFAKEMGLQDLKVCLLSEV
jgi:carnitine O-acetyltransferase